MIRTDLGIATAYAEAVSKGYTGTRDEFGELLANAGKNAKQVADDRTAVEAAKKSVDQTADKFDSHVAEKKEEVTNAISEHAEAAKNAAESVINDAKDAGVSAVNTASETGVNNVNSAQTEGVAAVNAAVEEGKKNFETDETLELSGCAADAAVTGAKINDLKKDIYFSKRPIGQPSAIISFIDDDCRIETYNKILPLMKESKVPWGIACPVGQLGTDTFMSVDQLKEMIAAGATVLSHHQKQYAMNQFQNRTEYEDELNKTDAAFKAIDLEPKGICYPNGIYVDDFMDIVKKHYEYGFTVDRGVNDIPLESLFLKRVEVFPKSEIYTLDDVKKYVDMLRDGEWLIFMTHAWYTTFDSAKLTELINYVKSKNVEIVSVDEGMSRVGNLEEHGIIRKPLEYMSTPFFCVDKIGAIHTNNQKFYQKSDEKLTNVTPGWNAGYNLTVNGTTPTASSKSRLVSSKVTVNAGEIYLISASNIYGNALYCIYDASDAVIAYEVSENTADGTVITKKRVAIPENASYMKIASNISTQPGGYEMLKVETVAVDYDFVPAGKKDVDSLKEDVADLKSVMKDIRNNTPHASTIKDFYNIRRTGKVYQTKIWKFATNPTSSGEKLLDNAGLEFIPSTDTTEGKDDYLNGNHPLFDWVHCNYKRNDDGTAYPIATEYDDTYQETGSVDVGAMQMSFWWNWDASNPEYDLVTISDTPNEKYKLKPWTECKRADGTITPWCIGSAYVSGIASDGLLRSQPGLKPERNQSYNNMITNYQKKGKGYLGAGSERNTFQILFNIIKGATKNSQSLFQGCTGYSFQYSASIESADAHTYFPVTNAQAQNILAGSYVSVGYGELKTDTNTVNNDRGVNTIHAYADDVKVLRIETLDENNKAVYLDIKTGFNTTPIKLSDTVNAPITITSMHWWSGSTDAVIGRHDGSFGSNTDRNHPYRVQGREYAVGGYMTASDTVMDLQSDYSKKVYVAPKGVAHSSSDATIRNAYTCVGTIPANPDGSGSDFWVGDIAVDVDTGVWFPSAKGSSDSQGFADMLYAGGKAASGTREYLQGGALWGWSGAGSAFVVCRGWLGGAGWDYLGCD